MNDKKEVIETVLPSLAAYEALMIIKRILDVKELEKKKELEKLERDGGNTMRLAKAVTIVEEPQPEPASPVKATGSPLKKGQTMTIPAEKSEAEKQKEFEKSSSELVEKLKKITEKREKLEAEAKETSTEVDKVRPLVYLE